MEQSALGLLKAKVVLHADQRINRYQRMLDSS